jgi:hypothetical protein
MSARPNSVVAGNTCQSISTSSSASSAIARVSAIAITMGSPSKTASSTASACWGGDTRPGAVAEMHWKVVHTGVRSAAVKTAVTSARPAAEAVSIDLIFACG